MIPGVLVASLLQFYRSSRPYWDPYQPTGENAEEELGSLLQKITTLNEDGSFEITIGNNHWSYAGDLQLWDIFSHLRRRGLDLEKDPTHQNWIKRLTQAFRCYKRHGGHSNLTLTDGLALNKTSLGE